MIPPSVVTGLLLGLLLVSAAWATAARTALFGLHGGDRKALAEGGRTDAQVLRLWEGRQSVLSTLRATTLAAQGTTACLAAAGLLAWQPGRVWLNILLLAPILLLLTEVTPRLLAFRYGLAIARLSAWPLAGLHHAVRPLRAPVTALSSLLARLLGGTPAHDGPTEEDLRLLLDHGAASGALDPMERDIIEAVFDLDDLTVDRLMTPRPDIFAIPLDVPWQDLLDRCRDARLSRIPVYLDRPDNIIGVLLLKDLLKHRRAPLQGPRQLRSLLLRPVFVPASKSADSMLREFLENRFHMAFVVDEHGALLGLVTLDDLLLELVGDPDSDSVDPAIARISPGALTVKASIDLQDFVEETGIALPEGDYRTLGGFVLHRLGRLPRTGDTVQHEGHRLTVTSMEGRRVSEVSVHRLPEGLGQEVAG